MLGSNSIKGDISAMCPYMYSAWANEDCTGHHQYLYHKFGYISANKTSTACASFSTRQLS